jgi:hypothetical protein
MSVLVLVLVMVLVMVLADLGAAFVLIPNGSL